MDLDQRRSGCLELHAFDGTGVGVGGLQRRGSDVSGAPLVADSVDNNCDGLIWEEELNPCAGDFDLDGSRSIDDMLFCCRGLVVVQGVSQAWTPRTRWTSETCCCGSGCWPRLRLTATLLLVVARAWSRRAHWR